METGLQQNSPKAEIHLHLDCSISYGVAAALVPGISPGQFRKRLVAPDKCINLKDYLTRAEAAIELLQDRRALQLTTLDLVRQLAAEGIGYAEIRFAPLEHTRGGLTAEAVLEAVLEAMEEGMQQYPIDCGVIICTLRHYEKNRSLIAAQLAIRYQQQGVIGFDLAADESYAADAHVAAFMYCADHGLPTTAHAGEARGAESVWEVIRKLRPQRIGHGVRSVEDPHLLDFLVANDIHLEVCPTSNIQTNVFPVMEQHCLPVLLEKGISFSLNTDSRTISYTSLFLEYQKVRETFGWTADQLAFPESEAIRHAFMPASRRRYVY